MKNGKKNLERFTNLRVILAQGHANLLCIVPILVYVHLESTLEDFIAWLK